MRVTFNGSTVQRFNGCNLDGWVLRRAGRGGYLVENGLLVSPANGGGYLFTEGEYDDFSLRFEFRLSEGANSGVAIRSPLLDKKPAYDGIEIQIQDKTTTPKVREKHPGLQRNSGHIGFLGHGSRVEFRNIRVKKTPDPGAADER